MSVYRLNPAIKGSAFVRMVIAEAVKKQGNNPERYAARRWGADSLAAKVMEAGGTEALAFEKGTVAAGGTVSGSWAELLTDAESATAEFFAFVRERSLLGRIPGFRRVPLRVRMLTATDGFTAAWVAEGKAVPLSAAAYDQETLNPLKVAALTVLTEELIESADPVAEISIRDDLAAALTAAIDSSLLNPANSGETDVSPASVTNGAPSVAATGDGLDDLRLLVDLLPATADLERAVLIGSPYSFLKLSDPMVLPGLGIRGGNALGIPAFPSKHAGDDLILVDPGGIAVGEGTIDIRVSRQASIEMRDDPTMDAVNPNGAATVSLWQTNSVGVMATAAINWEPARVSAAVLSGVDQS